MICGVISEEESQIALNRTRFFVAITLLFVLIPVFLLLALRGKYVNAAVIAFFVVVLTLVAVGLFEYSRTISEHAE
jgi:Ca2+/Na+ antiporter